MHTGKKGPQRREVRKTSNCSVAIAASRRAERRRDLKQKLRNAFEAGLAALDASRTQPATPRPAAAPG